MSFSLVSRWKLGYAAASLRLYVLFLRAAVNLARDAVMLGQGDQVGHYRIGAPPHGHQGEGARLRPAPDWLV